MSVESSAIESSMSHLPTITQVPHIIVRSSTVDPASSPIPTDTWLWATSVLPESPDTRHNKKHKLGIKNKQTNTHTSTKWAQILIDEMRAT